MAMDFSKLMPGKKVRNRILLRKGRQWKFSSRCHLLKDIPEKTVFKVGGLHTKELWADLKAEPPVDLSLRVSAEELAVAFEFA
jgi:hypothetical protein